MSAWRRRLADLKDGGLWRVLAVYLAAGWVALEAVDLLTSVLRLPDWFPALALGILIAGLPIVLATAWVQSGARRPDPAARTSSTAPAEPAASAPVGALAYLTWRNAIAAGVLAFAAWGVVAAAWAVFGRPNAPAPTGVAAADAGAAQRVAILPFTVRGGEDYAYLGDAMVNLLSTKLDGAGELRSVDARSVLGFLDGRGARGVGDGAMVARRFDAGVWVTGDIVEIGRVLQISASVYRLESGDEPVATHAVEGDDADLMDLVDRLAGSLLGELGGGASERVQTIAAVTTDSIDALKAFLEGERLYRNGRFDDASDAFERAVRVDTTFALAYYRLSLLAEWNLRGDLADWAAERAVRHLERLPQRERRLLEALQVRRTGDNERAARMYRSILSLYPEEREALIDLAEILIHAAPLRAGSFADSREAFEQVLALDPEHSTSLLHLARVAAAEGELAELDSLTRTFLSVNPSGDRGLEISTLRAFARRDPRLEAEAMQSLSRPETSELSIALAAWDVATYARNLDGAERIIRLLAEPHRSLGGHTLAHSWLAHVLAARGRFDAARAEFRELASENPGVATEFEALLALAPFLPAEPGRLRELRERVRDVDPAAIPTSNNPSIVFSALDGLHPVILAYIDGLLSARLGDDAGVDRATERLRSLDVPQGAGSLNLDLMLAVEAERAWLAGDAQAAFDSLDSARREVWYGQTMASPYFAQARERFAQGELLVALGRDEEALPWYEHLVELGPFELLYYPIAELRQAEIHQRQGRPERARSHYRRFLELWADADPVTGAIVEEARRNLDRLSAP
ncbi:MAG TPA: tetratricopeptide repeat protein [Longimicrobiales bacterium]|nr:tetratricopeptide repeat protein [Longimicrobiales bacterium]